MRRQWVTKCRAVDRALFRDESGSSRLPSGDRPTRRTVQTWSRSVRDEVGMIRQTARELSRKYRRVEQADANFGDARGGYIAAEGQSSVRPSPSIFSTAVPRLIEFAPEFP